MSSEGLFTDDVAGGRPARTTGAGQYAELKRLIKKNGLLDRQPAYYAAKISFTLALLAASVALVPILGGSRLQLLNAAFMAFAFVQVGLLAHDFGHRQFTLRAPGTTPTSP